MKYGYVRVATDEGSIDKQVRRLREYDIDKWYIEISSGSSIDNCSQLQNMLKALKEGDIVYVTDFSRITRNLTDLFRVQEIFREHEIELVSVNQPPTEENSVMRAFMQALQQYEQEIFSRSEE